MLAVRPDHRREVVLVPGGSQERRVILGGVINSLTTTPAHILFLTWPSVALFYLRDFVWPVHLSYIYPLHLQDRLVFRSCLFEITGFFGLASSLKVPTDLALHLRLGDYRQRRALRDTEQD